MSDKTGGPAFPYQIDLSNGDGSETTHYSMGMSMRDYFAAKAMQGVLAVNPHRLPSAIAARAYQVADAMLKERDK